MAPQQGPEVPDTGRLVADGDQGQALVRPSGASQEVPGALCHQHEVQGQDDLGVRLAGLLALLEGRRGRVVSSPCPEGSEVYSLVCLPLAVFQQLLYGPTLLCCSISCGRSRQLHWSVTVSVVSAAVYGKHAF